MMAPYSAADRFSGCAGRLITETNSDWLLNFFYFIVIHRTANGGQGEFPVFELFFA